MESSQNAASGTGVSGGNAITIPQINAAAAAAAAATAGAGSEDPKQNLNQVINSIQKTLGLLHQLYLTVSSFNVASQLPLLQRLNVLVSELDNMTKLSEKCNIQVPMEVLNLIDEGKNPDEFTRDVLNSCIAKNQITKGKTDSFKFCRKVFQYQAPVPTVLMQRKRRLAQTAAEMAPPKAQFKSKPVQPTQKSYQKILSVHSIHQRILRQALLQEQKTSSQKIQATVPLDPPETTELLQCISECLMEISHRNSLMEIELGTFRDQPEVHHQGRSHNDASAEEATFAAAEFQGDTPEAFDQANLPKQKSHSADQVKMDAVQHVLAQQLEEREADEASEGRRLLNSQVKEEKALLALRNGFVDLRTQIQAAWKGFMEG